MEHFYFKIKVAIKHQEKKENYCGFHLTGSVIVQSYIIYKKIPPHFSLYGKIVSDQGVGKFPEYFICFPWLQIA